MDAVCSFWFYRLQLPRCGPRIAILENVTGCLKRGHGGLASDDEFQAWGSQYVGLKLTLILDSLGPRLLPDQPRACCVMINDNVQCVVLRSTRSGGM